MSHLYGTLYDNDQSHNDTDNITMEIVNQLHGHLDFQTISNYYDLFTYNNLCKSHHTHNLNIIHVNSRSLPKNSDNINSLIKSLHIQPDILVITETWLTDNNKQLYELTGYHSYHIVRNTRRQGGVSIFIYDQISSQGISNLLSLLLNSN